MGIMNKYIDNSLVEEMDAIVLLNDNYIEQGLKKGYIGVVMDNAVKKEGIVIADFSNPITGEAILPVVDIKKEDFRVISASLEDQKLVKAFKDLFRK